MTAAEKYVLAAYLVVLGAVLLYVVLYSFKLARLEREVAELTALAERRNAQLREPELRQKEPVT